ncbi:MAG TPA: MATE family efflux transporter [Pseudobacteroides sp.]|uniref:MATE family efflux transporter n=1 Tax=Pseudobacteroides sp. TaxID=1968840 RepID=UPI002F9566B5
MEKGQVLDKRITLFALLWPILIETFLRMLFGTVDTFMLSGYNDNAVAGVGAANQYVSILILLFQMVSGGSSIIISQYLGARNNKKASDVAMVSIMFNLVFGLFISVILLVFSGKILGLMNFQRDVYQYSKEFLSILGSFSFIQAVSITISAILRSHGHVKYPMYVNMGANALNILGNFMFIYGMFGMPVLGVKGVAISTVSSQLIGLIVIFIILKNKVGLRFSVVEVLKMPKNAIAQILKSIFKIGGPSAGESISYNISQVVITGLIATYMGEYALQTRFYVFNLMFYIMLFGLATGQATQIMIGHLIGAGRTDDAYKTCLRSLKIAVTVSFIVAVMFFIFGKVFLGFFTDNENIITIGGMLFAITVILEPGRSFNLVVGFSLKGAGDARFILYLGLVSMWSVAVFMSYFLGVVLHLGLIGVWTAFAMDEWIRGIVMLKRWRSRAWEKMSVVSKEDKVGIETKDEELLQSVN